MNEKFPGHKVCLFHHRSFSSSIDQEKCENEKNEKKAKNIKNNKITTRKKKRNFHKTLNWLYKSNQSADCFLRREENNKKEEGNYFIIFFLLFFLLLGWNFFFPVVGNYFHILLTNTRFACGEKKLFLIISYFPSFSPHCNRN